MLSPRDAKKWYNGLVHTHSSAQGGGAIDSCSEKKQLRTFAMLRCRAKIIIMTPTMPTNLSLWNGKNFPPLLLRYAVMPKKLHRAHWRDN